MAVLGMGGLFFRSDDPEALAAWYKQHLGVGAGCDSTGEGNGNEWVWQVQGGPMVFAPFKRDTDYFAADKAFMINLRVSELDPLLEKLRSAGIEVSEDTSAAATGSDAGNLLARLPGPEGAPTILLCAHLDTVPLAAPVDEKPNVGVGSVVVDPSEGPESMNESGATLSTVIESQATVELPSPLGQTWATLFGFGGSSPGPATALEGKSSVTDPSKTLKHVL